jgi:hypothetical protein
MVGVHELLWPMRLRLVDMQEEPISFVKKENFQCWCCLDVASIFLLFSWSVTSNPSILYGYLEGCASRIFVFAASKYASSIAEGCLCPFCFRLQSLQWRKSAPTTRMIGHSLLTSRACDDIHHVECYVTPTSCHSLFFGAGKGLLWELVWMLQHVFQHISCAHPQFSFCCVGKSKDHARKVWQYSMSYMMPRQINSWEKCALMRCDSTTTFPTHPLVTIISLVQVEQHDDSINGDHSSHRFGQTTMAFNFRKKYNIGWEYLANES